MGLTFQGPMNLGEQCCSQRGSACTLHCWYQPLPCVISALDPSMSLQLPCPLVHLTGEPTLGHTYSSFPSLFSTLFSYGELPSPEIHLSHLSCHPHWLLQCTAGPRQPGMGSELPPSMWGGRCSPLLSYSEPEEAASPLAGVGERRTPVSKLALCTTRSVRFTCKLKVHCPF